MFGLSAAVLLTAGLAFATPLMTADSTGSVKPMQAQNPLENNPEQVATESIPSHLWADGVYLYGQSAERDQIGAAYMVFAVDQGQVTGAFYMPYSSFDCFHGSFEADRLAMTVIDSYERTAYPYEIALEPTDNLAAAETEATPVTIQGFHAIPNPSQNDLRILSTCQADQR